MKITMNGETIELPPRSNLDDLCRLLEVSNKNSVISVNGEVVRKSDYASYMLKEASVVEVMVFVGGG